MNERTIGQEIARDAAGKAVMWIPAIASAVMLGPVGFFAGLVVSVAILAACCTGDEDSKK